jgi:hypothetical protein
MPVNPAQPGGDNGGVKGDPSIKQDMGQIGIKPGQQPG